MVPDENLHVLVGRQTELELLGGRLEEGRPIAVLGEAGVGKTTLVRVAAQRTGRRLVEAGALATLQWLPYLPLTRAVGREFTGDVEHVCGALETDLAGAILFLDDLQWADAPTVALVPLLVPRVSLVVAVRRGDPGTPSALEAIRASGVELLPLEPLPPADAAALARALHPGLSTTATRRLVTGSGGNPFLIEQLAASGEPSDSLRRALAARVRVLSPSGRDAIAALALLGRPAPPRLVGPGAAEIVAAGLADVEDDVSIRHALLAEAVSENLSEEERRAIHSRLAAALDDVGESARHHADAGEDAFALEKALVAADRAATPGERAAHLRIAGRVATGPGANEIRLRAADALLEDGRASEAETVLERLESDDPPVLARSCLLRCRSRVARHDVAGAWAAWERGIDLAAGTASRVELDLRVEESQLLSLVVVVDHDLRPVRAAESALRLADELGVDHPRAHQLLGASRLEAGVSGWDDELLRAMELARKEGDVQTLVAAGRTLAYGYLVTGRIDTGRRFTLDLLDEARALQLTGQERLFRVWLAGFQLHAGSPAATVSEIEDVLDGAVEPTVGTTARCWLVEALVELGRLDEARRVVDHLLTTAPRDHMSYGHVLWVASELELFSGRLREAVAFADECLERFPGEGAGIFVKLARNWAALELGLELGEPMPRPFHAMGEAAPIEEDGVRALAAGQPEGAAQLLVRAAELWRGRHSRGELRCLWGAGEASRRAGDAERAVELLLLAERETIARESLAHLGRIHRSLRLAGVHRAADRTRHGDLTGREAEVLDLVGAGLTNDEIARRLGVGRPTVARLIRAASAKLGAESRAQAAAIAARG